MRIPESWLREWVDPSLDTRALADRLTLAGHEVDDIERHGDGLDDIVVAEVLAAHKHPDADTLSVCQVATDGYTVQVVCGAPNVRIGMKGAYAPAGATLPDGTRIRRRKIRGVESNGMLCSEWELGIGEDADGIIELAADALPGTRLTRLWQLPDHILELNLTPNRGDCFSIRGIAREVSALTGAPLKPQLTEAVTPVNGVSRSVMIDDPDSCPRFAGRTLRGIDPRARTPQWMSERLRRCGIRSIHPVVDVTNYVMLETGQPLHAYDDDRLRGAIHPRFAGKGETVTLLDEREVNLNSDTLVISDDSGPIGLAGIMGGLTTAVTADTVNVFFEAAFWPQALVAGRARAYGLHTDASLRFERGVDPAGQAQAVERATRLLLDIAGGAPGPLDDQCHADAVPVNPWIELRRERLASLLGARLADEQVAAILEGLGLAVDAMPAGWRVQAPGFRFDLQIETDLIEEVARVYGYERIPETTATAALPLRPVTEQRVDLERISQTLVARDYCEVVTYSFIDTESNRRFTGSETELELSNPISSEMSVMRGSLLPGMLKVAATNLARQQTRIRLFEIGTSFHGSLSKPVEIQRLAGLMLGPLQDEQWGSVQRNADFFDIKSDIEALLLLTGASTSVTYEPTEHPALQPGQTARILRNGQVVGLAGKLHPSAGRWFDINREIVLFELAIQPAFAAEIPRAEAPSRFPSVRRDIAVVVDNDVAVDQLINVVLSAAPDIIRQVVIFDVYCGPGIEAGRKSVALGLILQETSRTLTDDDADSATLAAVRGLQRELAAILRE
ncbi:MAG: phenylalanine--tRNA ligase subunit beta [Woeseia sp.]